MISTESVRSVVALRDDTLLVTGLGIPMKVNLHRRVPTQQEEAPRKPALLKIDGKYILPENLLYMFTEFLAPGREGTRLVFANNGWVTVMTDIDEVARIINEHMS